MASPFLTYAQVFKEWWHFWRMDDTNGSVREVLLLFRGLSHEQCCISAPGAVHWSVCSLCPYLWKGIVCCSLIKVGTMKLLGREYLDVAISVWHLTCALYVVHPCKFVEWECSSQTVASQAEPISCPLYLRSKCSTKPQSDLRFPLRIFSWGSRVCWLRWPSPRG